MLGIISLCTGAFMGFATSLMFKHKRFLTHNAVCETFVIVGMSMFTYFATDMIIIAGIEMSGIISLLTCGII